MKSISRKAFLKGSAAIGVLGLLPAQARKPAVAQTSSKILLTDAIVLTMDGTRRAFENGYVWIKDGRIEDVDSMATLGPVPEDVIRRSAQGHLIMPGLINCHTHLSNGIMRGIYDEMPLEVWFSKGMWPVLDALDGAAAEPAAELSILELMTTGVATVATGKMATANPDVPDGVCAALERTGMRAVLSRITMDSPDDTSAAQFIPEAYREKPDAAAQGVWRLQKRFNSSRLMVVPEALGVLRCTAEMVQAMHQVSLDTDSHFVMHAASSQDERDESRRRFGHGSITELERLGVLGPKTVLAHGVWLDDGEIDLVAKRQTGISHNPVPNAYYASGVARLPDLIEADVRVGLGTDGASTNNSQNVWETMKMSVLIQKQWREQASFGSAELALELMTIGGARALHLENEIGSLKAGKRADLIVVDTERLAPSPSQTLVSNLEYSNDPLVVRDVYIDGERLVENGRHRDLDHATVISNARSAAATVLARTGLDSYLTERTTWAWE